MAETAEINQSGKQEEDQPPPINTFRRWFKQDKQASSDWRKEAKDDFDFVVGKQWTDEDTEHLRGQNRPPVAFNRAKPVIDAVAGYEIQNRQEIRFFPREQGDVQANEVLTSAAKWFRDLSDAEHEESDAFRDAVICGLGCTESRIDYANNPDGEPTDQRVNPLEMYWDANAIRVNLTDARRLHRVRKLSVREAKGMFPGVEEEMLDAVWATSDGSDDGPNSSDPQDAYRGGGKSDDEDSDTVTIVHTQWQESRVYWRVVDPMTGQETEISDDEAKVLQERMAQMGQPFTGAKQARFVRRQAFLGKDVLEVSDCPCPTHFTFSFITGFPDWNAKTWFGLVRTMKDPQRWANKWLSQSMHILNSQAKGGIMVEEGAVSDEREFEKSWTRTDAVSYLKDGAIAGRKVDRKPAADFPTGFFQLMEFAISSVRDTTGVSLEMLGMREANQPIGLEQTRKQSGIAILAGLFDSLRRFRKNKGRLLLYYIQNYLSDDRLVRVVGESGEQYVPLSKQADVAYDVIVDDAPRSPHQKEQVWAFLAPMFWQLPPPVQMAFVEYLPLPASVIEKVKQAAEQAMQKASEPKPGEQEMMQAEIGQKQAKAEKDQASAELDRVKAQVEMIRVEMERMAQVVQAFMPPQQMPAQAAS